MAGVDSFAIELPVPVDWDKPLYITDSGIGSLFEDTRAAAPEAPFFVPDDSAHSSPAGYSPPHVQSPQPACAATESSSEESHVRQPIIEKLPSTTTRKRAGT